MSSLVYATTETLTIRRGFETRYRIQLKLKLADGTEIPQALTGFTITVQFRQAEAKDGTAVTGVTPTGPVVDNDSGVFDYLLSQSETPTVVVGKRYFGHVYASHATITGGKDQLIRLLPFEVVA